MFVVNIFVNISNKQKICQIGKEIGVDIVGFQTLCDVIGNMAVSELYLYCLLFV